LSTALQQGLRFKFMNKSEPQEEKSLLNHGEKISFLTIRFLTVLDKLQRLLDQTPQNKCIEQLISELSAQHKILKTELDVLDQSLLKEYDQESKASTTTPRRLTRD